MRSIVSKGKTIQEAIETGLNLLEVSKDEVNIEIIQQESKSFFKMKSKAAIVKLTKLEQKPTKKQESAENQINVDSFEVINEWIDNIPDPKTMPDFLAVEQDNEFTQEEWVEPQSESLAGNAWVKNGMLLCECSPTRFPMVTIPDGVKVYRNNQIIQEHTFVMTEKDEYEIRLESEEKETSWELVMDPQKLHVELHIEPGYKITRSLCDTEPAQHIDLVIEERKEVQNTLSYEDVVNKLADLRVKHGFHQGEIIKATEASEPGVFKIASGIEAIPGKDGYIELKINTETENKLKENEDGRVDYREFKTIPNVEVGTVIAIVHPPIPGEPGRTVTNEPIPPKQAAHVFVKIGRGITVVDNKIIAIKSGRPYFEERGNIVKLSVMPKLIHQGNVDLSSGNIRFMGDVEITGEVCERMKVEAEGNIVVHKSVNMASLTASGAVVVSGNIVSSEITAGKNNIVVAEVGNLLGPINKELIRIIQIMKQLMSSPGFKANDLSRNGLQPLIKLLLEKKFSTFPALIKQYVKTVKKGENYLTDKIWVETAASLSKLFLSLSKEVISIEWIMELSKRLQELHELSQMPVEPNSYIVIPNALNSRLYCSGDVKVTEQGSVNTKIVAGGKLNIKGALRGGEVFGQLGAKVNAAGSESQTPTLISVPRDQKIYIDKAMDGTSIKIGNAQYNLIETRKHIIAYLDKNEKISFE